MEVGQEAGSLDDVSLNPWKQEMTVLTRLSYSVLFTLSFLDRTNVGTAKLAGLTKDLHMTQYQFNIASTIFFVSYVAGVFSNEPVMLYTKVSCRDR